MTTNGVLWDGIPIFVDPIGLQEAGQTMNSPVTVPSKAVPIRKALEDALGHINFFYIIKYEWIMIMLNESLLEDFP